MAILVLLIFALFVLAAAAFVAWPAWRTEAGGNAARAALAGAIVLLVFAIGGGLYWWLGRPDLAQRSLTRIEDRDYAGVIAELARDVRRRPNDVRGWLYLGAGYMKLRDPDDAAKAFARAIQTAGPKPPPGLYALCGEALTEAASGAIGPEAAAAFEKTIALDPRNVMARYYLGLWHAQKHETEQAVAIWRSLLADAPPGAPWRGEVVNRIAMLR